MPLSWPLSLAFGAIGGLLLELTMLLALINDWQAKRRIAVDARKRRPQFARAVDPLPHLASGAVRMVVGAGAAAAFHGQVTGVSAAIAVGLAGPALVQRLVDLRATQVMGLQPDDELVAETR